ncbi:MAG: hypothetical protein GEU95_26050 [Rhizobiales bacterium]|nr:hypothetical protein [Hyphomicrobiales bacterium]
MPLMLVAVMPQMTLVAVMMVMEAVVRPAMAATMSAVPVARGRVIGGREDGSERDHGNSGREETRGGHFPYP